MNRADACSAALPAMIRMLLDLNRIRLTGMVMAGRQPTALHHGRIGEGLEEFRWKRLLILRPTGPRPSKNGL